MKNALIALLLAGSLGGVAAAAPSPAPKMTGHMTSGHMMSGHKPQPAMKKPAMKKPAMKPAMKKPAMAKPKPSPMATHRSGN